ncbi:inositol monophosphatase family protein [Niabella hibiscisoli]|uniref:inositol monophosphatase family protein n=1 Tax=Niabella hibiscisoli TaxID=1825928 RepID=UPI00293F0D52|nr:inositol monophosphatase family protein [Niabella hibiscisoli]
MPLNCISIGVEFKGEMILGMVYNPHMNELFFAEKGEGATLNGQAIKVSAETDVMKSCLVTGFPYTYIQQNNGPIEVFERFVREGVPVRRLGAAAIDLCWVAAAFRWILRA